MRGVRKLAIQLVSDIHFEHSSTPKALSDSIVSRLVRGRGDTSPIVVVAGDVATPSSERWTWYFFESLRKHYDWVVYVPGNHEYGCPKTRSEIDEIDSKLADRTVSSGAIYLQKNTVDVNGVLFAGATLWSHVPSVIHPTTIRNELFFDQFKWLNSVITTTKQATVVVTHHLPSRRLIHDRFIRCPNLVKAHYASDIDFLIESHDSPVVCWLAGHTHVSMAVEFHCLGRMPTSVYTNPWSGVGRPTNPDFRVVPFECLV